jgi:hypothetical protein
MVAGSRPAGVRQYPARDEELGFAFSARRPGDFPPRSNFIEGLNQDGASAIECPFRSNSRSWAAHSAFALITRM